MGVFRPSPNAMASRLAIEARKPMVVCAPLVSAPPMILWSAVLDSRIAKTVLHCEKIVASSSLGPLRDDAEVDAVFAAFLGDARDCLPCRPEGGIRVSRDVAVRFLADHQRLHAALARQRKVECHTAQHRHHRTDDFARQPDISTTQIGRPFCGTRKMSDMICCMRSPPALALPNMNSKRGSRPMEVIRSFSDFRSGFSCLPSSFPSRSSMSLIRSISRYGTG